jgi:hypothetical protein
MPELRDFDLDLLVAFDLLMQEQNVARGGTHIRQPVGDEPHPAETAAATGRSIAGQDALRHEANGQGGIGTLTYKWASACATRFGHESHLLCPSTHRNRNRDRNEYFAPDIKRRGLQLRQKPGHQRPPAVGGFIIIPRNIRETHIGIHLSANVFLAG